MPMHATNWRPLILSSLLVAQKVKIKLFINKINNIKKRFGMISIYPMQILLSFIRFLLLKKLIDLNKNF